MSTPNSKLLKLKTDFTSLKYSQDRPDGGYSGQPYVESPLPQNATQEQLDVYQLVRSGVDNPIRVASKVIDGTPVPIFAPIDRDRIAHLLKFTTKGKLFGKKQKELALMNPKMEVSAQANLGGRNSTPIEYTRIYKEDNSNLLTQISKQGSGYHLDKNGVFAVTPYQSKYEYVVSHKGVNENRLKVLHDLKVLDKPFLTDEDQSLGIIQTLGLSRQRNFLFEYQGGPQSNGETSFTTIQRYSFTNTWKDVRLNGLSGSRYDLYSTGSNYVDRNRLISLASQSMDYKSSNFIAPGTSIREIGLPNGITQKDSSVMSIKRYDNTDTWNGFEFPSFKKPKINQSNTNIPSDSVVVTANRKERLKTLYSDLVKGNIDPGGVLYVINIPQAARSNFSGSSSDVIIRRSTEDTFANQTTATDILGTSIGTIAEINRPKSLTYDQLLKKMKEDLPNRGSNGINTAGTILPDFRTEIIGSKGPMTNGYQGGSGEGFRVYKKGMGNPGTKIINREDYSLVGTRGNDLGVDKINALDVGQSSAEAYTDMIKCIITAMEVQPDNSNKAVPMVFRAFVTNLQDNYQANYETHQYVGRGEKFYTYNNSERKIQFTLTLAAQSRTEMQPMYRKLNYLVSQTYPAYADFNNSTGTGFMRAPLVQMTIGDYIYEQPGFINAIGLAMVENSSWEIVEDPAVKDKLMHQLPHAIKADIQFTPIHNFLPRRSFDKTNITPFITPNSKAGAINNFGI